MSSSIEKEISPGKFFLFFTYIMKLISSLVSWGEIIDLRDKTICCIVGLSLGSSDQHANYKKKVKIKLNKYLKLIINNLFHYYLPVYKLLYSTGVPLIIFSRLPFAIDMIRLV